MEEEYCLMSSFSYWCGQRGE